jgi:hypothetical protein
VLDLIYEASMAVTATIVGFLVKVYEALVRLFYWIKSCFVEPYDSEELPLSKKPISRYCFDVGYLLTPRNNEGGTVSCPAPSNEAERVDLTCWHNLINNCRRGNSCSTSELVSFIDQYITDHGTLSEELGGFGLHLVANIHRIMTRIGNDAPMPQIHCFGPDIAYHVFFHGPHQALLMAARDGAAAIVDHFIQQQRKDPFLMRIYDPQINAQINVNPNAVGHHIGFSLWLAPDNRLHAFAISSTGRVDGTLNEIINLLINEARPALAGVGLSFVDYDGRPYYIPNHRNSMGLDCGTMTILCLVCMYIWYHAWGMCDPNEVKVEILDKLPRREKGSVAERYKLSAFDTALAGHRPIAQESPPEPAPVLSAAEAVGPELIRA